jgi:hypothetical protein
MLRPTLEQEREVGAVRHDDELPGTLFRGQNVHGWAKGGDERLIVQLDGMVVLPCMSTKSGAESMFVLTRHDQETVAYGDKPRRCIGQLQLPSWRPHRRDLRLDIAV